MDFFIGAVRIVSGDGWQLQGVVSRGGAGRLGGGAGRLGCGCGLSAEARLDVSVWGEGGVGVVSRGGAASGLGGVGVGVFCRVASWCV